MNLDFIKGFFQTDGNKSMTRLIVFSWLCGILVIWIISSLFGIYHGKGLSDIPSSIVTMAGLVLGSKMIQNFSESSAEKEVVQQTVIDPNTAPENKDNKDTKEIKQ